MQSAPPSARLVQSATALCSLVTALVAAIAAGGCQLVARFDRIASKSERPTYCLDGVDNDGDSLVDAVDPDCALGAITASAVVLGQATILFVIDDTGGICEERTAIDTGIPAFVAALLAAAPTVELHAGVISPDTADPLRRGRLNDYVTTVTASTSCPTPPPAPACDSLEPLARWVDEASADPVSLLRCLGQVGMGGFGLETPLGAARLALSPDLLGPGGWNAGFALPGSVLALVLLSDEDDCSVCTATDCTPPPGFQSNLDCYINRVDELTPATSIADSLWDAWGAFSGSPLLARRILVTTFLGLDALGSAVAPVVADPLGADAVMPICSNPAVGSAPPALRLHAFTERLGGVESSICASDYSVALVTAALRLAEETRSACLEVAPCDTFDELIEVTLDGLLLSREAYFIAADSRCAGGWRVSLVADPPPGALLNLEYITGPGPCL